jgi:hypothetical protein
MEESKCAVVLKFVMGTPLFSKSATQSWSRAIVFPCFDNVLLDLLPECRCFCLGVLRLQLLQPEDLVKL